MTEEPSTRVSLLDRLRQQPTDQQAWQEFVERYAPILHSWCRHWRLQEADAEDVTQGVLLVLATRMKTFTYNPARRFRAWMRTVERHAWAAFVEGRQRAALSSDDSRVHPVLETLEAPDELVRRLEETFDRELLELAMDHVRQRVEERTWEAFRLTALEQCPAASVASRLGMKTVTVYVARSRVQKLIRTEVQRLDGAPLPPSEKPS